MPDTDAPQHRAYYQPDPDDVAVRQLEDGEEGLLAIRMPISSTVEARDGEAFDADRLRGYARQINDGVVKVFMDHGTNSDLAPSRYSAAGVLGVFDNAEVDPMDDREDESELVADVRLMDPETLPSATGELREHLARIKSQAERDIPLTASVGWTDEVGDRDVPGDSDLLEGSIVGIPSDPTATTDEASAAVEMARVAVQERAADPEQLVEEFRAVVMGPDPDDTMSNDTESGEEDPPDDDPERDESDGISAEAFREEMLELQREQTETIRDVHDAVREDDMDDDDEDDEDDMETSSTEPDAERTLEVDGDEMTAADVRELRDQLDDADPDPDPTGGAEDGDERSETDSDADDSDPVDLLR